MVRRVRAREHQAWVSRMIIMTKANWQTYLLNLLAYRHLWNGAVMPPTTKRSPTDANKKKRGEEKKLPPIYICMQQHCRATSMVDTLSGAPDG